jgi:hypothetical protein
MVPRVACVARAVAESPRFPENPGQGASPFRRASRRHRPQPVRTQERETAKALFTTAEGVPNALAEKIMATVSTQASRAAVNTDEPKAAVTPGNAGRLMTKEEQVRLSCHLFTTPSLTRCRRGSRKPSRKRPQWPRSVGSSRVLRKAFCRPWTRSGREASKYDAVLLVARLSSLHILLCQQAACYSSHRVQSDVT